MKKLALASVLAALALPGAARSAGCSPLDCAPTGSSLGHGLYAVRPNGVLGAVVVDDVRTGHTRYQLPDGILGGHLLVHQEQGGDALTWFDAYSGSVVANASAPGFGQQSLAGVSQDGRRAVLFHVVKGRSRFAIVAPRTRAATVTLPTANWGFDALAGSNLFLLRYKRNGYEVRRYDLAAHRLVAAPLKDPQGSSLIWGSAWDRVASPNGRYLFTLYIAPNGAAMVHELDVRHAIARCVDLPGTGDFNKGTSYVLQLAPGGRTLWAFSPGYGRAVSIDVAAARVRSAFSFKAWAPNAPSATVAAISANGAKLAAAIGGKLWVMSTRDGTVSRRSARANALWFDPTGERLWVARGTVVRGLRVNG
jgi:hypothetical protein